MSRRKIKSKVKRKSGKISKKRYNAEEKRVVKSGSCLTCECRNGERKTGNSEKTGREATHSDERNLSAVRYEDGKTLCIGEFEFARIMMSIEQSGDDRDKILNENRIITNEFIEREAAGILGLPRDNIRYIGPSGKNIIIEVGYGLTLRGEIKNETDKFDVFLREPLSNGDDFEVKMSEIESWLTEKILEEKRAAENIVEDSGL